MESLDINKKTGILGQISNNRYIGQKLRFSGYPYVGCKYSEAKKKILFVGLDIGIDECRDENTYHTFDSRREVVAGSTEGCTSLGYNNHISGTYGMALYILKDLYDWNKQWDSLYKIKDTIFISAINQFKLDLPVDVLDYVALTNIHKFVTVCRGCNFSKQKPTCWSENCITNELNRSGSSNRKWYNYNEEIKMIMDEIEIFNPDVIYFQGSVSPIYNKLKQLNSNCEIWIANHPSAWNVGANKPSYVENERLSINPIGTL
jgi:hypothetical protein